MSIVHGQSPTFLMVMRRLSVLIAVIFCCLSPAAAQQYNVPCNQSFQPSPQILQEYEDLLQRQSIGTCTVYKGDFCEGILNPGDYVLVGPKTIFNLSDTTVQGNLTYLTTYLEQYWNLSRLLESSHSHLCKQVMRRFLCRYYYPVCRNASGNATVFHPICTANCNYIAQELCPTEWAMLYNLALTAPMGFNLRPSCIGETNGVRVPNPGCCISIYVASASTTAISPDSTFAGPSVVTTSVNTMQLSTVPMLFTSSDTKTATSFSLLASPSSTVVVVVSSNNSKTILQASVAGATVGGVIVAAIVLGFICVCILLSHRWQKRLRRQVTLTGLLYPRTSSDPSEFQQTPNPYLLSINQVHLTSCGGRMVKVPSNYLRHLSGKLLIPEHCLQILDCIGQGEFGIVYRAYLRDWAKYPSPHLVAVKTINGEVSDTQISQMLEESVKMKDFDHPNILSLIGVCIAAGNAPYIVMPFMANGSLLSYLKQERHKLTIANGAEQDLITETQRILLSICLQIAKGMEYLSSQKFVHRDLAARNCMIDLNNVIKVADFGLSEDIYAKNYYRQGDSEENKVKLPIKWMAPESLHDGVFSERTDVWSYGVTCWEVFTLGKIPYPGVTPFTLVKYLNEGGRLEKPCNAACSDEIYDLMRKCWMQEPMCRPLFSDLVLTICGILEPLAGYLEFKLPTSEDLVFNNNPESIPSPTTPIIVIEDTNT